VILAVALVECVAFHEVQTIGTKKQQEKSYIIDLNIVKTV